LRKNNIIRRWKETQENANPRYKTDEEILLQMEAELQAVADTAVAKIKRLFEIEEVKA
jgi:hypothetical protein